MRLGILFGSYAKGNYSFGSDIDVLIVASNLPRDLSERFSLLLNPNLPVQIQPFGYTTDEFNKMLKEKHPFIAEALRKGKILYATPDLRKLIEMYHSRVC